MIFNPILLFPSYSKIFYFIFEWSCATQFLLLCTLRISCSLNLLIRNRGSVDVTDDESVFLYPFRFLLVSAVYNDWWIKNFRLDLILSIGIFSYPDYFAKMETWVSALETYV